MKPLTDDDRRLVILLAHGIAADKPQKMRLRKWRRLLSLAARLLEVIGCG